MLEGHNGFNLYAYVNGGPTNAKDPFGLIDERAIEALAKQLNHDLFARRVSAQKELFSELKSLGDIDKLGLFYDKNETTLPPEVKLRIQEVIIDGIKMRFRDFNGPASFNMHLPDLSVAKYRAGIVPLREMMRNVEEMWHEEKFTSEVVKKLAPSLLWDRLDKSPGTVAELRRNLLSFAIEADLLFEGGGMISVGYKPTHEEMGTGFSLEMTYGLIDKSKSAKYEFEVK